MRLSAPAAAAAVTLTWEVGNHLERDRYDLVAQPVAAPATTFDDAVLGARALVHAAERDVPGFGRLAPVHAVIAVDGGFAPAALRTAAGFEVPIDGGVANGGSGAMLRGLTIDRAASGAALAALVGAASLVDLRTAPSTSDWWRSADPGREPGAWLRR